jgi:hypothetical protein
MVCRHLRGRAGAIDPLLFDDDYHVLWYWPYNARRAYALEMPTRARRAVEGAALNLQRRDCADLRISQGRAGHAHQQPTSDEGFAGERSRSSHEDFAVKFNYWFIACPLAISYRIHGLSQIA